MMVEQLSVGSDTTLRVALTIVPAFFHLRDITVTPGAFAIMEAAPATRQTMSRDEIESAPFNDDLFRAVNRLPGLTSGDYSAHFSVRGGRHDETLILDLTYRSDRMSSMTAAYAFHTGWPATTESIVTVIDSPGQSQPTIKPEKLYGSRLPSYHRLDLRITRRSRPGEVNWACSPR